MAKTLISEDDPGFGHLAAKLGNPAYVVDGDDRLEVGAIIDLSGQTPTVITSLELPHDDAEAVLNAEHPDGFTGVVREALIEWVERHT